MSTHNIYFCGEIRKILCGYPLLSVAMLLLIILIVSVKFYENVTNLVYLGQKD